MSGVTITPGRPGGASAAWWLGQRAVAVFRGLALCGLMLAGSGPVLLAVLLLTAIRSGANRAGLPGHQGLPGLAAPQGSLGPGIHQGHDGRLLALLLLAGVSVLATRWLARLTRRLAAQWCGVPIAAPYRSRPGGPGPGRLSFGQRTEWVLSDPATWRDLLWSAADACGGWVLAAAPAAIVAYGLVAIALPALGLPRGGVHGQLLVVLASSPYLASLTAWLAVPLGLAVAMTGLWAAPPLLRAYGGLARSMLGPSRQAGLARQVRHLAETRSDTIDTGAAEMRRIERDLHDGAQARLVAMGMALDAAGQLLDDNPAAARALLLEARDSSARALAELRDLVRGIHPPVLADRGLADAIRALALDFPLRTEVAGGLAGRPPAPVESAAYFAVSELLANVSKHADAGQVWIDFGHERGLLRISVADSGRGGADPARGTGLRGIERRLAAFDGVLAVSSPPGGPTVVNMEIPCALSSPKTSSC